jgi:hypothetical protein
MRLPAAAITAFALLPAAARAQDALKLERSDGLSDRS